MDTAQWMKEIGAAKSMTEITPNTCSNERKVKPQKDHSLNCPRCHSTNTKFCYYNNYSLTQPRYFCKTCRRYWTEGGTLRNVPVGGGSRKNRKSTSSLLSPHKIPDLNPSSSISQFTSLNPKVHEGQDLTLAYHGIPQFLEFPKIENSNAVNSLSSSSSPSTPLFSALDLLRTGIASRGFIPTPAVERNTAFASGFSFQESKPAIDFSSDGLGINAYGVSMKGDNENGGRLVFPFGAMRQHMSNKVDQRKGQENPNGYWNGMFGGGSSW